MTGPPLGLRSVRSLRHDLPRAVGLLAGGAIAAAELGTDETAERGAEQRPAGLIGSGIARTAAERHGAGQRRRHEDLCRELTHVVTLSFFGIIPQSTALGLDGCQRMLLNSAEN